MDKKIYLLGWEVHLNGDTRCQNFIATHITDKKTAKSQEGSLELIFKNDKLVQAFEYLDEEKDEKLLKEDELGLLFPNYPLNSNKLLKFVQHDSGYHQLGGEIPSQFKMPEHNCIVPFQYLGFFDNNEVNFSWLPFKLHLACPIYLNFDKVYLDYSDPLYPVVINREELEKAETADILNKDSEIAFEELRFNSIESTEFSPIGNGGIPLWIQYPDIPVCPKTNKLMKFVGQTIGGTPTKRSNIFTENKNYMNHYETLNFWDDGDLFIFFEPESKVACYIIQNT